MLKNTVILGLRMLLTMLVGFYSIRELIGVLGVYDFGLINIVLSVSGIFTFISSVLQASALKFYAYGVESKEGGGINTVFSMFLLIFVLAGFVFLVVSEVFGYWYLDEILVISSTRRSSMEYFFHLSVITIFLNILTVPFWTMLISLDRLAYYSFATISESILRLLIIYIIKLLPLDPVVSYGVLLLFVAISIFVIYVFYFSMYLNFLKYQYFWDKKIAVQIFSFSGWNLWGGLSGFFTNTLVNTLINNNFGPIINASRSISLQVSNSLGAFVNNVLMGYRARIIRLYASGNRSAAIDLTISASRYCYYSTLIIVVPIACEMNYLMHVWIKEVPIYAVTFTQLMLFQKLIEVISYPFVILSHATGKIALYQTVVGVIQWMIFPVAWIFLLKFNNPTIIFCISILLSLVANIAQVYMINVVLKINNQVINFKKIFVNFFILFIYTVILALLLQLVIPEGGVRFMLSIIVTLTFGFMAIYRYSLEYSEKSYLVSVSKRIIAFNK